MWKHDSFQAAPAALEVGAESIRLMQLARAGEQWRVEIAVRRFFSSDRLERPQMFKQILQRATESAPLSTRDVIAALPSNCVQIRTLRVDPTGAGDIDGAIRAMHAGTFPFPLTEARLQCINAGLVRQGEQERLEIIAVAARHQDIDEFLATLDAARLRPISLRLANFAGMHCARRGANETQPSPQAMIELHDDYTSVMIWRGQDVKFLRLLPLGVRQLNQAIAVKFDLSLAEAAHLRLRLSQWPASEAPQHEGIGPAVYGAMRGLLGQLGREVAACLQYYTVAFREPRPASIALLGADAGEAHIIDALSAAVGIPVDITNPLAGMDTSAMRSADLNAPPGEWTTCVGLTLGEMMETVDV